MKNFLTLALAAVAFPVMVIAQSAGTVPSGPVSSAGTVPSGTGTAAVTGPATVAATPLDAAALFLLLDTNRDGVLSREEFARIGQAMAAGAKPGAASSGTTGSTSTSGSPR